MKKDIISYMLRVSDISFWRQAKAKASMEGKPLSQIIFGLLRLWIDGKVKV